VGDTLVIVQSPSDGWLLASKDGRQGLVPESYVMEVIE
jgi:hypothetical protein